MTFTWLSDDFTDRPELLEVSRSARLLLVEMMVWSNRMLTDGLVPPNALRRICDVDDIDKDLAELLDAGVVTELGDGRLQLDWTHQETAEKVSKRRKDNEEKQRRYRERKERHKQGDHGLCDLRHCREAQRQRITGNETGSATGHETSHVTGPQSQPQSHSQSPTHREGTGDKGMDGARSAEAPRRATQHSFEDDGSHITCRRCECHRNHRVHQEAS